MPDEDHGSIVLRSHYDGLEKMFDGWRCRGPQRPFEGGYEGGRGSLRETFRPAGLDITPPEATVNALGYATMAAHRSRRRWIPPGQRPAYPDSANVYDSLGEGLEAAGRLDDAWLSMRKPSAAVKRRRTRCSTPSAAHRDAVRKKIAERQMTPMASAAGRGRRGGPAACPVRRLSNPAASMADVQRSRLASG